MKLSKLFLFGLLAAALASCGGSDEEDFNGGSTGEKTTTANNTNSNFSNSNKMTHRMEFPKVKGGNNLVITHTLSDGEVNYSVEYDTQVKSTRWSCYQIYSGNLPTNGVKRYYSKSNQYPQDPELPEIYRWKKDPFWRSGYDHGHLCPSADRLHSTNANYQTFYLTNMLPQVNGFNARVWANMEKFVRDQIKNGSRDTLFVVKGGTIDNKSQYTTMARSGGNLIIPKYFYMALLMHNSNGYKAMGFWIRHESNNDTSLKKYVVNIHKLEQLAGIDFFCNLPDDIENKVENLSQDKVVRAWSVK